MNNSFERLISGIVPFIMLGIAVSLMIGLVIMFSYVLLWGVFIGFVLWAIVSVKEYFFPSKKINIRGRIIEYTYKDQDNDKN